MRPATADNSHPTASGPDVSPERREAPSAKALAKGALAGAIAGVAGSVAILAAMKGGERLGPAPVKEEARQGSKEMHEIRMEFADRVAEATTGEPVPESRERSASLAVHLATGALGGALYGAAVEVDERVTLGHGMAFGTAFFLASREVALPVLGLAPSPAQTPFREHAEGLGLHLFYGAVAETVREPTRRALG